MHCFNVETAQISFLIIGIFCNIWACAVFGGFSPLTLDVGPSIRALPARVKLSKKKPTIFMVTTGFSGSIPLGRVIYGMTSIICHFTDPSKPKDSEL